VNNAHSFTAYRKVWPMLKPSSVPITTELQQQHNLHGTFKQFYYYTLNLDTFFLTNWDISVIIINRKEDRELHATNKM
jgi:hypothetical protein